ncbi:MAG: peptidoglycan-binding protein, partial [Oscillospiraceae bacterium]
MATGILQVMAVTQGSIPLENVKITITDGENMRVLEDKITYTDPQGKTPDIVLETKPKRLSLDVDNEEIPYKNYNVCVMLGKYIHGEILGVQIFEGQTTVQYIDLLPRPTDFGSEFERQVDVGEPEKLYDPAPDLKEGISSYVLQSVVIPEYITVHLGKPTASAQNVRVPFITYLKSVAASEIYPTWPREALRANICAQISFALNRIYTEWYPSRGYNFNITNSPSYDQKYVHNRSTFETTDREVETIFNNYVTKRGKKEPYFTEYCDGKTVKCKGMSQWGSYSDAQAGKSALQILQKYYGSDVSISQSSNIAPIPVSYGGTPLRRGATGEDVRVIAAQLNRIGDNYPSIPKVKVDGVFGAALETAVKKFQSIFNLTQDGVIGKSTWYKISYIYVSVKKLAQLTSEGEAIDDGAYPGKVVRRGDKGRNVLIVQFYINQTAVYVDSIDEVVLDGIFGAALEKSVKEFQKFFNLTADGKVGELTWNKMYEIFLSIKNGVTVPPQTQPNADKYPGTPLQIGSSGTNVVKVQNWLNGVSKVYTTVP